MSQSATHAYDCPARDDDCTCGIAELERDAARYRWLRLRRGDSAESWFYKDGPVVVPSAKDHGQVLGGDWLDHAVDRAMAASSSKPHTQDRSERKL